MKNKNKFSSVLTCLKLIAIFASEWLFCCALGVVRNRVNVLVQATKLFTQNRLPQSLNVKFFRIPILLFLLKLGFKVFLLLLLKTKLYH